MTVRLVPSPLMWADVEEETGPQNGKISHECRWYCHVIMSVFVISKSLE